MKRHTNTINVDELSSHEATSSEGCRPDQPIVIDAEEPVVPQQAKRQRYSLPNEGVDDDQETLFHLRNYLSLCK